MSIINREQAGAVDAVREALSEQLRITVDQVEPQERLDLLPNADSVRLMQAVSKLERRFDIELDDDDIMKAETVADLARLIEEELANAGGLG
jgi:acyl carrier protein